MSGGKSARGWESAKNRLGFGKVVQDGDCEGSIILDRLPAKAEAEGIRDIVGIPKARHLGEEQRPACVKRGTLNLQRFRDQGPEAA
jgi:hypothetical protein